MPCLKIILYCCCVFKIAVTIDCHQYFIGDCHVISDITHSLKALTSWDFDCPMLIRSEHVWQFLARSNKTGPLIYVAVT